MIGHPASRADLDIWHHLSISAANPLHGRQVLQDGCGVKSSRNLGLFKQRQFEVVCNPILNLWTWPGGNALGRSTDHGCCLSWWQSCPILFHRFTEHARMKGDHFSNLILTLAITMIIIPATTTITIVITIIVVVVVIDILILILIIIFIWTLTPAYAPLHPKFAATEQNCKLVYQSRFHSMIHCIETRGGEDDSFDQVLSQTEQTESTEHCSWAYCQLTINAPARGGEYRGILLELSKPFTKFTRNLHRFGFWPRPFRIPPWHAEHWEYPRRQSAHWSSSRQVRSNSHDRPGKP